MSENLELSSAMPAGDQILQDAYHRNVDGVYRFIYSRVGNREDAEDLTSQVFLKAVYNLDGAREEASIRSWLFHLARTTVADYWRLYYRGPTIPLQLLPFEAPVDRDDPGPHPAEATVAKLLRELPDNFGRCCSIGSWKDCPCERRRQRWERPKAT